jgi:hypothetical protein
VLREGTGITPGYTSDDPMAEMFESLRRARTGGDPNVR